METNYDQLTWSDWLSIIGSIASFLGLILTLWVAFAVRDIKKRFSFKARVPNLVRQLKGHSSKISESLNDFPKFKEIIREELVKAEVVLKSLRGKVKGDPKKSVSELIKTVKQYNSENLTKDQTRDLYRAMIKVSAEIEQYQKDLEWE